MGRLSARLGALHQINPHGNPERFQCFVLVRMRSRLSYACSGGSHLVRKSAAPVRTMAQKLPIRFQEHLQVGFMASANV